MKYNNQKHILSESVPVPEHPPAGVSTPHTQKIWYTLDDRIKRNVLSVSASLSRNKDGLTPRDQYILKHQYQGQRNLDNMASAVQNVALQGLRPMQAMGRHLGVGSDVGFFQRMSSVNIPRSVLVWIISQSIVRQRNVISDYLNISANSITVTDASSIANNRRILADVRRGLVTTMFNVEGIDLSAEHKSTIRQFINTSIDNDTIERNIFSGNLIEVIRNKDRFERELEQFMKRHVMTNLKTESLFDKTFNKYKSLLETNTDTNNNNEETQQTNSGTPSPTTPQPTTGTQQQNQQFGPRVQNPQQSSWQQAQQAQQQASDNLQAEITPTLAAMKQGNLPPASSQTETTPAPETPKYDERIDQAAQSMQGAQHSFTGLRNSNDVEAVRQRLIQSFRDGGEEVPDNMPLDQLMQKRMPWLMGASIIGGDGQAVGPDASSTSSTTSETDTEEETDTENGNWWSRFTNR